MSVFFVALLDEIAPTRFREWYACGSLSRDLDVGWRGVNKGGGKKTAHPFSKLDASKLAREEAKRNPEREDRHCLRFCANCQGSTPFDTSRRRKTFSSLSFPPLLADSHSLPRQLVATFKHPSQLQGKEETLKRRTERRGDEREWKESKTQE